MALHAVENVEDALGVTREFLTPVDVRRWLKLALVVFFVGGGTGVPTSGANTASPTGDVSVSGSLPDIPGDAWLVLAAVVALVVLVGLVLMAVGAVMEFVFVESLRSGAVTVRRYWRRRWRQGLRLFGFRFVLAVLTLALVAGLLAVVVGPFLLGVGIPVAPLLGLAVAVPVLFVVGVVTAVVNGFTTEFVVPIMILEDVGVLDGWRRLWPSVRAAWKQYLAYAVLAFVLRLGLGLAAGLVVGLVALVLLVPFGGLGLLVAATLSLSSTAGLALVAVLALVFGLLLVVASAVVQVPVQTYLRYYALLVLGDVEPSFDLVPDRRAAVRE
jgi:hypothetical protein